MLRSVRIKVVVCTALLTATLAVSLPEVVHAVILTALDGDSSLSFDTENEAIGPWQVEGVNHHGQQEFYFRLGEAVPESNLTSLTLIHAENHGPDAFHLIYLGVPFGAEITYQVTDGPGGTSRLDQWVTLRQGSLQPVDLHWFDFTDLAVDGIPDDNDAELVAPGEIVQSHPGGSTIRKVSENVVPSHWEIAFTGDLELAFREDGVPTVLGDTGSPFVGHDIGEGLIVKDATHAFQYDLSLLPAPESFEIHTFYELGAFGTPGPVVPEPASLALFGIGLVGAGWSRRRQRG